MGARKDVSLPPVEPTVSPGTESLRKYDQDMMNCSFEILMLYKREGYDELRILRLDNTVNVSSI